MDRQSEQDHIAHAKARLRLCATGRQVLEQARRCHIDIAFCEPRALGGGKFYGQFFHSINGARIDPRTSDAGVPLVIAHEMIHGLSWHAGKSHFGPHRQAISRDLWAPEEAQALAVEVMVAEELGKLGHVEYLEWMLTSLDAEPFYQYFRARVSGEDPVDAMAECLEKQR